MKTKKREMAGDETLVRVLDEAQKIHVGLGDRLVAWAILVGLKVDPDLAGHIVRGADL